ncbi:winged helix-turn-helix domain-containing protein [Parabacteroides distasonis]|nr:winged helix-turn-helix domain-containing protein [Parabacteroides distasonis]
MEKGRIGLNAGKVWHALNEVNEISTQELSRKLSLSIEDLALAIGWLARENNIYITRKNVSTQFRASPFERALFSALNRVLLIN